MPQQDLLIKNGHVVTMDPDTGDLPHADIRVRDGVIQEIGTGLQATVGARIIDVAGKVVRFTLRARARYVRGCA